MKDKPERRKLALQQCSEDLLFTIPRLAHCFRPHGTFPLENGGHLSIGQGRLLMLIACGTQSVSELAEQGHVSPPTISRKLDLLVDKGLVSRRRDPEDRRSVLLDVTEQGRHTLEGMRDYVNQRLSGYLDGLTDGELEQIQQSLTLLRKAFDITDQEMGSCAP